MSLYDEKECVKNMETETWRPGIQFLESHLRIKKSGTKTSERFKTVQLAPVVNLHTRQKSVSKLRTNPHIESPEAPNYLLKQSLSDWALDDEYNPTQPCDYFKVKKELNRWREKEKKRKLSARSDLESSSRNMRKESPSTVPTQSATLSQIGVKNFLSNYGYDSDDDSDEDKDLRVSVSSGQFPSTSQFAKIPPPISLLSQPQPILLPPATPPTFRESHAISLPVGLVSQTLPQVQQELMSYSKSAPLSPGMSPPQQIVQSKLNCPSEVVAAKIMAKYGFKEGHGLGKDEQGMSTALQVQRTSRNCGRIVHEKDLMPPPPPKDALIVGTTDADGSNDSDNTTTPEELSMIEMLKHPTKVVMLSNMVGPGEVDDQLEEEITEECNAKYGEVLNVQICEQAGVADEEAVRVFVEFRRTEIAIKALVDLNGRYFGGRMVKANFFESSN